MVSWTGFGAVVVVRLSGVDVVPAGGERFEGVAEVVGAGL
jgi:hypothetical protein